MKRYSHYYIAILFIVFCNLSGLSITPRFGLTGGVLLSTPKGVDPKIGFSLGAVGEYEFSDNYDTFFASSGIVLKSLGWHKSYLMDTDGNSVDWKCQLYYLELPINLGYKFAIADNTRFMAQAGPYFAAGLSGKTNFESKADISSLENLDSGNLFSNGVYKRFDCGTGMGVGMEFNNKLQFMIKYDFSFMKPTHKWKLMNLRNRNASINISYFFD